MSERSRRGIIGPDPQLKIEVTTTKEGKTSVDIKMPDGMAYTIGEAHPGQQINVCANLEGGWSRLIVQPGHR